MMRRERAAGYYAELAWAAGEMVVELPYLLLQTCLYSVITYFMIWFEINAGEDATCTLHAIAGQTAPWHPPTALQGNVLAMCLHEHCSDRNLQDGICPHDIDLQTCSKDASDAHCMTAELNALQTSTACMNLLCGRAAKFWIYWAFTFMTLTFFTMYGMMTVAISPNVQVSSLADVSFSASASY